MRKFYILFFFFLILSACSQIIQQPTSFPTVTASPIPTSTPTFLPSPTIPPYQTLLSIDDQLPGAAPQRFGESFFSGSFHSAPVFSPDMKTMWWGGEYGSATIYFSQFSEGEWSDPETIAFSESITSYRDPFISPDGSKFYFISTTADTDSSSTGKENIWMVEKQGNSWGEPQPLPPSINELTLHWTMSVDNQYNLYFSAQKDGKPDIYISRFIDGGYTDPKPLDAPVNTDEIEITPNIAPDGSYLLFTRLESNVDPPFLYITYAQDLGWSEPVRVENVSYCISPIITPDRAYVIYLSSPDSFDWRDTSFIEELQP